MKNIVACSIVLLCLLSCCRSGSMSDSARLEEKTWRRVCSSCHPIEDANPNFYPAWDWPRVVDKMQNKKGVKQFSDKEKALVLKYLTSKANPQ